MKRILSVFVALVVVAGVLALLSRDPEPMSQAPELKALLAGARVGSYVGEVYSEPRGCLIDTGYFRVTTFDFDEPEEDIARKLERALPRPEWDVSVRPVGPHYILADKLGAPLGDGLKAELRTVQTEHGTRLMLYSPRLPLPSWKGDFLRAVHLVRPPEWQPF